MQNTSKKKGFNWNLNEKCKIVSEVDLVSEGTVVTAVRNEKQLDL